MARPAPRPALSEGDVVAAALRLTRRVGLSGLSMRALAEELGVTTMAAYHYVPSKESLLDLVANAVLGSVEPAAEGDWAHRLAESNRRMRRALLEHPGLSTYLQERPLTTTGRRMTDEVLAMLQAAGFSRRDARLASATMQAFLLGRLSMEGADPSGGSHRADEVFEFGLRAVIAGLQEHVRGHGGRGTR